MQILPIEVVREHGQFVKRAALSICICPFIFSTVLKFLTPEAVAGERRRRPHCLNKSRTNARATDRTEKQSRSSVTAAVETFLFRSDTIRVARAPATTVPQLLVRISWVRRAILVPSPSHPPALSKARYDSSWDPSLSGFAASGQASYMIWPDSICSMATIESSCRIGVQQPSFSGSRIACDRSGCIIALLCPPWKKSGEEKC